MEIDKVHDIMKRYNALTLEQKQLFIHILDQSFPAGLLHGGADHAADN